MEIPKNSYACANCHQRFNNPTILIKHVELRHSKAKQSQNGFRSTEPEEINASMENRDPLENTSTSVVPFEFSCPISNSMEMDPLELPIKDKYEEIGDQELKSEKKNQNDTVNRYTTSIHEGKKVFKCNICCKTFGKKQNVNEHIASVHEGTKAFKCDTCDKNLTTKKGMNNHIASVHKGTKPFKCEVCDYSFSQKSSLKTHVSSVHEGKKAFKCRICDKSFSEKGSVKKHVSIIHEGKKAS